MDFDLVMIGGGSAGVRGARIAASLGAKVALVESAELGGTCVNLGCVPKKLFTYGARYSEHFEDAAGYGWSVGETGFDWRALVDAKDRELARLNGIYARILERAGVTLVRGFGRVAGPHEVVVGDRSLSTEHVVVATGGRPWRPAIPGAEHTVVSDDVFSLETLPDRMVIVGGGYVACEFASIFNGLGVQVTLLYRGDVFLRGFDGEIRGALAAEMRKKGIDVRFNAPIAAVEDEGRCMVEVDGTRHETDLIFLATGREPNVDGLGLEALGVQLGPAGVKIDRHFRTSVPSIYAIGDCADRGANNHWALTPVALAEGMALAHHLFGEGDGLVDYHDIPTAVFTAPNMAAVGLSEEEAREHLPNGRVYVEGFRPMVHTLSGRDERILMKLIVDGATDKVVGAHMLGPDAGELIQGLAVAIRAGATKAHFDQTIGIHPTAAEEFVTMRTVARTW